MPGLGLGMHEVDIFRKEPPVYDEDSMGEKHVRRSDADDVERSVERVFNALKETAFGQRIDTNEVLETLATVADVDAFSKTVADVMGIAAQGATAGVVLGNPLVGVGVFSVLLRGKLQQRKKEKQKDTQDSRAMERLLALMQSTQDSVLRSFCRDGQKLNAIQRQLDDLSQKFEVRLDSGEEEARDLLPNDVEIEGFVASLKPILDEIVQRLNGFETAVQERVRSERTRAELEETNRSLTETNSLLARTNARLAEAKSEIEFRTREELEQAAARIKFLELEAESASKRVDALEPEVVRLTSELETRQAEYGELLHTIAANSPDTIKSKAIELLAQGDVEGYRRLFRAQDERLQSERVENHLSQAEVEILGGDLEAAWLCLEATLQRANEEQTIRVGNLLNEMVMLGHGRGVWSASIKYGEVALSLRREVLGDRHPDTLTSLNNLAGLYEATGRYSEAEPLRGGTYASPRSSR